MISNEEYRRLCEIDSKMLDDEIITQAEIEERLRIIQKMKGF